MKLPTNRSHPTSCQFICHYPLTFHLCPEWQYCLGSHASPERGAAEPGSLYKPCCGLLLRWELFIIFWKVYVTDVTRQTSKHILPEPEAHGARHAHTCQYQYKESCWVMEGVCSDGRALLGSPANVSVWPCCIFSLSSWLGQCCLPTTSNALTLFRCISKDSSVRTET